MLNVECVDKTDTSVEICFTDPDGDESVKICVSVKVAWDIVRAIRKRLLWMWLDCNKEI